MPRPTPGVFSFVQRVVQNADVEYFVDPDIRKASTLPSTFYTDPATYEAVREYAFASSWQWVNDIDHAKVPGQVYPHVLLPGLLDEPIVFTRDTNDQLHCLSNVCTHRGMTVCEGAGNVRFLRCRYHGRRFGLDGRFQHMPEFEGAEGFPSEADHLPAIPMKLWAGHLFASLNPSASFEDVFGPMIERVGWMPIHEFRHDPTHSRDYMVKAHWALYVDNYLEGFHIPFIHAELNEVITYETYETLVFPHCNLQLADSKGGEAVFDLPTSSPDFGRKIAAYYWWVYPNMMFNFYPWGLSINIVKPLGPNATRVSFIRYVWREDLVDQGAGAALDRVEREDEVVVELVHIGLKSRFYDRGRFSPAREVGTHHFHRLLAESCAKSI